MAQATASFGSTMGGYGIKPAPVPAPKAAPTALISDTTTASFVKDVLEESKIQPVLVDFWAPWCGPCKALTPIIEKAVTQAKGKVKLVKMNIDDHPEVAGQLGIQSIPAVVAFVKGQGIDGFMGAQSEPQVKAFIEKLTKGMVNETDEILAHAQTLLEQGDVMDAVEIFVAILSEEPENLKALTGLMEAHLTLENLPQVQGLLTQVPKEKLNDPSVLKIKAALELANAAKNLSPTAELEAQIAHDPNNHQARFELSLALNANGAREEAADQLLHIFKADKTWNEEAARKQLVTFFESWGAMDKATLYGRRKLSSLMFR
jgi:putative thioredoxin